MHCRNTRGGCSCAQPYPIRLRLRPIWRPRVPTLCSAMQQSGGNMEAQRKRNSRLSRSVEGKVVLVTGAASGMGRATAHLFGDEGAHVIVTDLGQDRVEA